MLRPPVGVERGGRASGRVVQQRAAAGLVIGKGDPCAVGIMLTGEAIVVVVDIACAEAAGIDPQRLPAGRIESVSDAMPEGIDELGLPVIGVVDEAVAVAVGIHERHTPAGGVVDLGRAETVGVEDCRSPGRPRR